MNQSEVIALAVQTLKLALLLSLPALLVGMVVGLIISIFQATTQINEMTLSFVPKIIAIAVILILTMPWMMNEMIDFTTYVFKLIPTFLR
ncbi:MULTISPECIES: flagellar biosynthesis protein FliQ [unclassified Lebetimonas]|jgi:flagellar biosynthetic protein FliQ|uniref:flagellar biosynthesis protein FliQ n=1 Tax=unclassified Lebetimonas TaxID=2648158 RepID=UPI0004653C31|nr:MULTISPECIES: flagellar biosynthesis protein FliQ [unclassified Lebetimonas]